ncbi:hypothetical protein [Actinoplanes rectilineatus]|nr:hypothetical protein [Actinoplanes rectilineatus]
MDDYDGGDEFEALRELSFQPGGLHHGRRVTTDTVTPIEEV